MVKGAVKVSIMKPGTRLATHAGPSNTRIRIHLGLVVPKGGPDVIGIKAGNVTSQWIEGKCIAFDDSFEHEAWNLSQEERVVLVVDVWHPEMDEPMRWGPRLRLGGAPWVAELCAVSCCGRAESIVENANEIAMYNYNKVVPSILPSIHPSTRESV